MKKTISKYFGVIVLFFILVFALYVRINQLGTNPPGMTDDEVRESYSAYSIWKTGKNLTENRIFPFTFILNRFSFSPVPIYISAPFVGILGLSPFSSRLPYAFAGICIVLLTYLLIKELTNDRKTAYIGTILISFNVWAIQLSRIAHESIFALLFYLIGTYVFVKDWKNIKYLHVYFSMFMLFLAFNSYDATKLLLVPIITILIAYKWKQIKESKHILMIISLSIIAILCIFLNLYFTENAGIHGSQLFIFQETTAASTAVELARRASLAPHFLQVLYHNKITYFTDIIVKHYLYAFSFEYLFLSQEASGIFSLWSRGNLFLFELPLLLLGCVRLITKRRKIWNLAIMMLLIAPIPSAIGPSPFTYATRSVFMLPWLILIVAFGVISFIEMSKNVLIRYICVMFLIGVYLYSISGYLTQYYYEWPKYNGKYYSEDIKKVVQLLNKYENQYENVLISNTNNTFLLQYAFYNRIDPGIIQSLLRQKESTYSFDSIHLTILPICLETKKSDPRYAFGTSTMYITKPDCHDQTPDQTLQLKDSETYWEIYFSSGSGNQFK